MDKKCLIEALQRSWYGLCMTGDGVNDSPALKAATLVSLWGWNGAPCEASDIVILNNSLTLCEMFLCTYGRQWANQWQIHYFPADKVNVTTIAKFFSLLFGLKATSFTIIQILLINLIMDTLAALAFGEKPTFGTVYEWKPVAKKLCNILDKIYEVCYWSC